LPQLRPGVPNFHRATLQITRERMALTQIFDKFNRVEGWNVDARVWRDEVLPALIRPSILNFWLVIMSFTM